MSFLWEWIVCMLWDVEQQVPKNAIRLLYLWLILYVSAGDFFTVPGADCVGSVEINSRAKSSENE